MQLYNEKTLYNFYVHSFFTIVHLIALYPFQSLDTGLKIGNVFLDRRLVRFVGIVYNFNTSEHKVKCDLFYFLSDSNRNGKYPHCIISKRNSDSIPLIIDTVFPQYIITGHSRRICRTSRWTA